MKETGSTSTCSNARWKWPSLRLRRAWIIKLSIKIQKITLTITKNSTSRNVCQLINSKNPDSKNEPGVGFQAGSASSDSLPSVQPVCIVSWLSSSLQNNVIIIMITCFSRHRALARSSPCHTEMFLSRSANLSFIIFNIFNIFNIVNVNLTCFASPSSRQWLAKLISPAPPQPSAASTGSCSPWQGYYC